MIILHKKRILVVLSMVAISIIAVTVGKGVGHVRLEDGEILGRFYCEIWGRFSNLTVLKSHS